MDALLASRLLIATTKLRTFLLPDTATPQEKVRWKALCGLATSLRSSRMMRMYAAKLNKSEFKTHLTDKERCILERMRPYFPASVWQRSSFGVALEGARKPRTRIANPINR